MQVCLGVLSKIYPTISGVKAFVTWYDCLSFRMPQQLCVKLLEAKKYNLVGLLAPDRQHGIPGARHYGRDWGHAGCSLRCVAANDYGWSYLHDRVTIHNIRWLYHVSLHASSEWFGPFARQVVCSWWSPATRFRDHHAPWRAHCTSGGPLNVRHGPWELCDPCQLCSCGCENWFKAQEEQEEEELRLLLRLSRACSFVTMPWDRRKCFANDLKYIELIHLENSVRSEWLEGGPYERAKKKEPALHVCKKFSNHFDIQSAFRNFFLHDLSLTLSTGKRAQREKEKERLR